MKHVVRGIALALVLCACGGLASPGAHRPDRSQGPSSHHHRVHYVVAVTGRHHHLFANRFGSKRMRDLGGHLLGAPAVAWAAGQIFFVAETRAGLSVRTPRTAWAPLVPGRFDCRAPELASHGGKLAVGCLRDNAIWAAEFAAPSAGNPQVDALINQGGTLGTGPGVSFYGARVDLEVVGGGYVLGRNYRANTYYRSLDQPPGQYTQDSLFQCAGQPTVTSAPASGANYLACVVRHRHRLTTRVIGITPDGEDVIPTAGRVAAGRIGLAPIRQRRMFTAYTNRHGATVVKTLRYLHHPIHRRVLYRHAIGGAAIAAGPRGYR